jgi:hypothetical protein
VQKARIVDRLQHEQRRERLTAETREVPGLHRETKREREMDTIK